MQHHWIGRKSNQHIPRSAPPVAPGTPDGRALAQGLASWILTGKHTAPPPESIPDAPAASDHAPAPAATSPTSPTVADTAAGSQPPSAAPESPQPRETPEPARDTRQEHEWTPEPTASVTPTITNLRPVPGGPASAPSGPTPKTATAPADPKPAPTLAQRFQLTCSISAVFGLRFQDSEDSSVRFGKHTAVLGCGVRMTERLSFRLLVLGYRYQKAPWDPNFTYAIAYRFTDWLTLSYSSYSAQFSDLSGNVLTAFSRGNLQLSTKLPKVPIGETRSFACSGFVSFPQGYDPRLGLTCGINATKKLTFRATLYAYPKSGQNDWDPDYVYTAFYAVTDRVSLEYSNYADNRWPWNGSNSAKPGPMGRAFRVSYQLRF